MPKRFYLVNDPAFSEYVFNVLVQVPKKIILELSDKEQIIFRSHVNMRKFADNESNEKRLLLLSRIGISYCMLFGPDKTDFDKLLEDTTATYEDPKARLQIIDQMAKGKIFVLSSRDILLSAHMAANNSHSQVYVLNYEYIQLQHRVAMINTDVYNVQQKEVQQAFFDLANIVRTTMIASDSMSIGSGVPEGQMKLLLALFAQKGNFVSADALSSLCGEQMRSRFVSKMATELIRSKHIDHLPVKTVDAGRSSKYMINEKGIESVMTYLKHIAKKSRQK